MFILKINPIKCVIYFVFYRLTVEISTYLTSRLEQAFNCYWNHHDII